MPRNPVTRAGRKRDVERVPLTVTLAKLLNRALLWMVLRVPGAVIVARAHEEHIIAVIECLLCTITMVDVPVDYRNPVGCDVGRSVSSERSLRCERDVVEVTESVCAIGLGVVAAGATQRIGERLLPIVFRPVKRLSRGSDGSPG